jgi:hypothetical protein
VRASTLIHYNRPVLLLHKNICYANVIIDAGEGTGQHAVHKSQ